MPNGHEPITPDDRADFLVLHGRGLSRNAIAAELGRSPSTVTKLARLAGVTFDRTATAAATAAKQADNRALRAALERELLLDADRMRRQLFAPVVVYAFGGKENEYNEHELTELDVRGKKDLMAAVTSAITSSLQLAKVDQDAGVDHSRSVLGQLGAALQAIAGEPEPTDPVAGRQAAPPNAIAGA